MHGTVCLWSKTSHPQISSGQSCGRKQQNRSVKSEICSEVVLTQQTKTESMFTLVALNTHIQYNLLRQARNVVGQIAQKGVTVFKNSSHFVWARPAFFNNTHPPNPSYLLINQCGNPCWCHSFLLLSVLQTVV